MRRSLEVVKTGLTLKFLKKCQFCPLRIHCFCGLMQFEKPNISQFKPKVLSKSFGNDFSIDIWRVVRVVEGAALEMLCPERDLGFESLTLRQIEPECAIRVQVYFICFSRILFYLCRKRQTCYCVYLLLLIY